MQKTHFDQVTDLVGDDKEIHKKLTGSYYTHPRYAQLAFEQLVTRAIGEAARNSPKDYVLLDRCAGSGNLWRHPLEVIKNPDTTEIVRQYMKAVLSRVVLNTLQENEYKILQEDFGPYVRAIRQGDALSEDAHNFFAGHCEGKIVIMFENPPYSAGGSSKTGFADMLGKAKANGVSVKKSSWMRSQMPEDVRKNITDISQEFIWSAFNLYAKSDEDEYILIAPLKYWKADGLCDRRFVDGYLFNKKHFSATVSSGVGCVRWSGEKKLSDTIRLTPYDINGDGELVRMSSGKLSSDIAWMMRSEIIDSSELPVHRVETNHTELLKDIPKAKVQNILCAFDGQIKSDNGQASLFDNSAAFCAIDHGGIPTNAYMHLRMTTQPSGSGVYKVPAYFRIDKSGIQSNAYIGLQCTTEPTVNGCYAVDANGQHLAALCCLFAMKQWMGVNLTRSFITDEVIYPSGDGGLEFLKDIDFVLACLYWTALTAHNHCLTLKRKDGTEILNEMCIEAGSSLRNLIDDIWDSASEKVRERCDILYTNWAELKVRAHDCGLHVGKRVGLHAIELELQKNKDCGLKHAMKGFKNLLVYFYEDFITPKLFEYQILK